MVTITDATGPHTFVVHNGQQGAQGPAGSNGADGTNGQDGVSPTVTTLTAGDSTVVTITDATGPHTFVVHNGQQGAQGEQGPAGTNGINGTNGQDGQDGADGFSPTVTTVSAGDSTTVTITDANGPHTFVLHNGQQGPAGPAGSNGTNGVDGTNGRGIQEIAGPVSAGNVDTYTIHYTDGTTSTFTVTNGLDGAAAAAGVGIQSITKTGTSGLEDTYTITYTNGTTSTYTVTNGAPGADGANGTNGTNGQDGQDGFSPTVTTLTAVDSTTVTITDANGPHTFVVRNGQQGPQGPIGPAGASGSNGTNGQDGVSPTVTTLTAGDSTTVTITDANGPHTFVLHNGQQGPQGPIGPAGTNGTDGTNGQDGRGIQSISGPVTNGLVDTYTIHYTDNTTSTFTVANGAAGAQGLQGEQGPQGPAGVSPTVTAAASGSNIVITVTDSAGTHEYTIPVSRDSVAQVNADWNATSGAAEILNKPTIPDISGLQHRIDSLQDILGAIAQNTFVCGVSKVKDYDGNEYNTLKLGDQCWMKENLRTTRYSDGTAIPTSSSISSTLPYRYYPGNDSTNVPVYGLLYNWTAVMHGAVASNTNPSKVQGVCPTGWHVPSEAEWNQLNVFVSSQSEYVCGDTNVNIAKAMCAATGWMSSVTDCTPGNNQDLNNATGFSVCAAGYYRGSTVYNVGYLAALWLSTKEGTEPNCGFWNFTTSYSWITSYQGYSGLSVRCIQDPEMSSSQMQDLLDSLKGEVQTLQNQQITSDFYCGYSTVRDYDDNEYNTIKMGSQCWMKENLKSEHYTDGTPIALGTDTSSVVANFYRPGNNIANVNTYGYLYNWKAVINNEEGHSGYIQGICPEGWHVPSRAEWDQLFTYVRSKDEYICGGSANNILKALAANTGWYNTSTACSPGNDMSSNNATGFGMTAAGMLTKNGGIVALGNSSGYWAHDGQGNVLQWPMFYNSYSVQPIFTGGSDAYQYKVEGHSMRCLRNEVEVTDVSPLQLLLYSLQRRIDSLENRVRDLEESRNETESRLFVCGDPLRDVDGNVYSTAKYGEQCWMKENLRVTHFSDGTEIPLRTDTSSTIACRFISSIDEPRLSKVGYAYNAKALLHGSNGSSDNPSGVQGVCPVGWHVPSKAEWVQLLDYIKGQNEYRCGSANDNIAKALASTSGWRSYTGACAVGNDLNANNASGFDIYPTAFMMNTGFSTSDGYAYFVTATRFSSSSLWVVSLNYSTATVATNGYMNDAAGAQVRCVRDPEMTGAAVPSAADVQDMINNSLASLLNRLDSMQNVIDDLTHQLGENDVCGFVTVTDYDGNVYNTVKVGNQCWMRENLRCEHYSDGTLIPLGTDTSSFVAYRYNPNNSADNVPTYGYMYNWTAAMKGGTSSSANPSGVQGICPTGWHVPSYDELTQMINYVRSKSDYWCADTNINISKALAATSGWSSSTTACAPGNNPADNNATGLSLVAAGYYDKQYRNLGNTCYMWSTTKYSYAFHISLQASRSFVSMTSSKPYYAFTVRCLRD